jgi:hypothetical protein
MVGVTASSTKWKGRVSKYSVLEQYTYIQFGIIIDD